MAVERYVLNRNMLVVNDLSSHYCEACWLKFKLTVLNICQCGSYWHKQSLNCFPLKLLYALHFSILDELKPTVPPEDWVEWFLHRLHQEPWALGGAVVIGVFVLGTMSLIVFALLWGCCCQTPKHRQMRKKKKKQSGNMVI